MEIIKLFLLGATGYLLAGFYDVAILYGKKLLKKILYIGFFITSIPYPIIFYIYKSPLSILAQWVIIPLIVMFGLLLIYSVLLEISFFAGKNGGLYQGGTYSISRHPGFIWFTMINLLVGIYFWNFHITLLCIGFTACNLVLIIVEDLILFPKMFPEYKEYRKKTPFFLSMQS
jgi:protein-S-isoprenylcysteine O-methyltransferase Ste14